MSNFINTTNIGDFSPETTYGISEQISYIFGIILTPILTIIGLTGNVLAICVLTRLVGRSSQCNLYSILVALMVADSVILILNFFGNVLTNLFIFTKWSAFRQWYIIEGYIVVSLWPLMISFQMISVYLTILISFDRWAAICRPFRKSKMYFTRKPPLCICAISIIYVLSIFYNIPRWWEIELCSMNISEKDCNSTNKNLSTPINSSKIVRTSFRKSELGLNTYYRYIYGAFFYTFFVFITPVLLISFTNINILYTIRTSHQERAKMTKSHFREIKRTQIPVAIVVMFYALGLLPLTTSIVESIHSTDSTFVHSNSWNSLVSVSNICVILNSSINIIVYCLVGNKFRQSLWCLIQCKPNNRLFNRASTKFTSLKQGTRASMTSFDNHKLTKMST